MIDYGLFYYCMGESEQAMLNFMGDMLAIPDPVVSKASFDAAWLANLDDPGSLFYNLWFQLWDLSVQYVEVIPGVPLEAVVWNLSDHLAFNLFRTDPDFDPTTPCPFTTGKYALPT